MQIGIYIKCIYMHDAKNSTSFTNVLGSRWNVKFKLHNLLIIYGDCGSVIISLFFSLFKLYYIKFDIT